VQENAILSASGTRCTVGLNGGIEAFKARGGFTGSRAQQQPFHKGAAVDHSKPTGPEYLEETEHSRARPLSTENSSKPNKADVTTLVNITSLDDIAVCLPTPVVCCTVRCGAVGSSLRRTKAEGRHTPPTVVCKPTAPQSKRTLSASRRLVVVLVVPCQGSLVR
jgi:hypothetical protein